MPCVHPEHGQVGRQGHPHRLEHRAVPTDREDDVGVQGLAGGADGGARHPGGIARLGGDFHATPGGASSEFGSHGSRGVSVGVDDQGELHANTTASMEGRPTAGQAPCRPWTKNSRLPVAPGMGEAQTPMGPMPAAARA